MTNHTDLINKLRDIASKGVSVWGDLQMEAADALEAAQAEIEAVRKANIDCVNHFDALRIDYDQALARIAKLEPKRNVSPPSGELVLHKMRYHFWEADDDGPADFELFDAGVECDTCIDVALVRQDRLDELIAAAGASPLTDTAAIDAGCRYITPLLTQGASPVQPTDLQAENAKLITALAACRDALPVPDAGSMVDNWYCTAMVDPLQVPEYVKACVENMNFHRDFYQRRVDLLQQWQSKMRDPERTICCDIIANGQTLPPKNAGNRYAVQPSQGLQSVADALTIEQLNDKVARLMAAQPSQVGGLSTEQLCYVQSALKAIRQYGNIYRYERHQVSPYEKIVDALAIVDAAINAKESK